MGMFSALVPSPLCSVMPHVPQEFALTPACYRIFLRRSELNLRRARTARKTGCLHFQTCLNFCVRLFTPQYPARGRAGCTACLWEDLVAPPMAPAACSCDWPGAMPGGGQKHHMHPPWRTLGAATLYFLSPLHPRVPAWPPSRPVDFVPLPAGAPTCSQGDAARASWPVLCRVCVFPSTRRRSLPRCHPVDVRASCSRCACEDREPSEAVVRVSLWSLWAGLPSCPSLPAPG